ncbi:MAG: GNAT family N-acetyltransferase, partial [Chloroflexota bacterium]
MPARLCLDGRSTWATIDVDAMVDPAYRRRGVFTALVRQAHTVWAAAGVRFSFGLPNDQWGSRIAALGWHTLFPLRWLNRPLRLEAVLARRWRRPALARLTALTPLWNGLWRGRPAGNKVSVEKVEKVGSEFDRLWEGLGNDNPVSIVRDRARIEWRYLSAPDRAYHVLLARRAGQPAGFLAYYLQESNGRRIGFIADLFAARDDRQSHKALVHHALAALTDAGADMAVTLAVPGHWLYNTWRWAGFLPGRHAFPVRYVPFAAKLPVELLHDPQNWHITGGDFDVM